MKDMDQIKVRHRNSAQKSQNASSHVSKPHTEATEEKAL